MDKKKFLNRALCFAFLISALLFKGEVSAKYKSDPTCFPVPMNVEGETIATQFYICLEVHEYNARASAFLQNLEKSSPESTLKNVLLSIKNGDFHEFQEISTEKDQKNLEFQYQMYRSLLSGINDPIIARRFDLGGLYYYVLNTANQKNPTVPVLVMKQGTDYLQSFESIGHPVCQNIASIRRASSKKPDQFKEVHNPKFNTEISLMPLFGETKESVVLLRFTGYKVIYPIFPLKPRKFKYSERYKPLLSFFEAFYASIASGNIESHLNYFGPKSKDKQRLFLDKFKSRKDLDEYQKTQKTFREVKYILDSDDFYILFYSGDADKSENAALAYDMVSKNSRGELKRVNYFIGGPFDLLLKSPDFLNKLTQVINVEPMCQDGSCVEGFN